MPLLLIWLIKELIDNITATVGDPLLIGSMTLTLVAVIVVWFLDEAASDFGTFVRKKQAIKLEAYMYGLLHEKATKLDLAYFENPEYYDILSRAASEAPWRPNSILNNIVSLFRGAVSLVIMASVLLSLHWLIALLLIIINIPAIWLRLHYSDVLYNFRREQTPEARKMAYYNWLLTGNRPSREVRLFGLGEYFMSAFNKSFSNTKDEEVNIIHKKAIIDIVSDVVKAAGVFFMLAYIGKKTVNGSISLGEMSMFILAFRQGMIYMKDMFASLAGLYEDSLFVGDTFDFLDLEEQVKAEKPVCPFANLSSSISIKNLSFSYPGSSHPTINDISFNIAKGEVVALVGKNGAGKSTLVRLLSRLYDPSSGNISWDGTNIKNFEPEEYRKHVSIVFQDFMLYNASVGDNIYMGDIFKKFDSQKAEEAAKISGINDLIKTLQKGYDTVIGNLFDDSRELSWGEWQKLAISRALYNDAELLILDEPSSALDVDTEYEIFNRFQEIINGRTTVLISHKLTNIMLADKIIVLDNGCVAETGTHEELLAHRGIYYQMFEKQTNRK